MPFAAKRTRSRSAAPRRPAVARQPAPLDDITERVGAAIKALRHERGYSLEDMAALTGVSRATLSQIETNKTNPTIGVLWRISAGLGVPFSALLGERASERIVTLRRGTQGSIRSEDGGFESRPLVPPRALGPVELYELTLAPRTKHVSPAHPQGTTEGVVVVSGIVRIGVGNEMRDGGTGDAIVFRADETHFYENPGKTVTKLFNVIAYGRGALGG